MREDYRNKRDSKDAKTIRFTVSSLRLIASK